MKNSDDELKDLFSEQHFENDFPADEDNWLVLAAEIKAKKKRRRFLFFFFLSGTAALILGTIMLWPLDSKNIAIQAPKPVVEIQSPPTKAEQNKPVQQNESVPQNKPLQQNTPAPINEIVKKSSSEAANNPTPVIKPETSSKPQPTVTPAAPVKSSVPLYSTEHKDSVGSPVPTSGSDIEAPDKALDRQKTDQTPHPDINPPHAGNSALSETKTKNTETVAVPGNSNASQTTEQATTQSVPVAKTGTTATAEESTGFQMPTDSNSATAPTLPAAAVPTVSVASDSLAKVTTPSVSPSIQNPLNGFHAEAGINGQQGWQTPNGREGRGVNPSVGINYYYPLSGRLCMGTGIQLFSIANLSQSTHSSTATQIRFGEERAVTTISAKSVYYIGVPLTLYYTFNASNFAGLGCNMAYLLNTRSNVNTNTTAHGVTSVTENYTAWGYSKGFSSVDWQLSVLYKHLFCKRILVGAGYFLGLSDLKNNAVYLSGKTERTSCIKISVAYIINLKGVR